MRIEFIHGLRGVAALLVVFFHLRIQVNPFLSSNFPIIDELLSYGFVGVPIFFVISGFVITLTVNVTKLDFRYFGKFVARRSVRLDIVYWITIALILCSGLLKDVLFSIESHDYSVWEILIHAFYLQDLFGLENQISIVFWTLCLEVQFYLFFILSLLFIKLLVRDDILKTDVVFLCLVGAPLAVYSLLIDLSVMPELLNGLFVKYWHYFFLGYLTCKFQQYRRVLILWWACLALSQIILEPKAYIVSALITSMLIVIFLANNIKARWLTNKVILYFGSVSYPLYLLHASLGWQSMSFLERFVPVESVHTMLAHLVTGLLVSILSAHVMHIVIEKPSIKFSKHLK